MKRTARRAIRSRGRPFEPRRIHGGPVWKWYEGLDGDGIHAARGNPGADWVTGTGDFAFSLIPAPSVLALLALAGAAGRRRRRS